MANLMSGLECKNIKEHLNSQNKRKNTSLEVQRRQKMSKDVY